MENATIDLLKKIKQDEFKFEHVSKYELVLELLSHIGHPDPEIRDDLIYECLAHLFYDHHFDEKELVYFLNILVDEKHMRFDIDNTVENSILTRSFSVLLMVVLIFIHQRDNVISKDVIIKIFKQFIDYFDQEKMLDGYDPKLGWMHVVAHSADLMNQFMQISWFKKDEIELMFKAISNKIKQDKHLFMFNEEERLVVALKSGMQRNILTAEYLINWVDQLVLTKMPTNIENKICLKSNIKHLLYALYFSLIDDEKYDYLTNYIKKKLLVFKN